MPFTRMHKREIFIIVFGQKCDIPSWTFTFRFLSPPLLSFYLAFVASFLCQMFLAKNIREVLSAFHLDDPDQD